jgi:hypothetical protein
MTTPEQGFSGPFSGPRPWRADPPSSPFGNWVVRDGDDYLVCTMRGGLKEQETNARRIVEGVNRGL